MLVTLREGKQHFVGAIVDKYGTAVQATSVPQLLAWVYHDYRYGRVMIIQVQEYCGYCCGVLYDCTNGSNVQRVCMHMRVFSAFILYKCLHIGFMCTIIYVSDNLKACLWEERETSDCMCTFNLRYSAILLILKLWAHCFHLMSLLLQHLIHKRLEVPHGCSCVKVTRQY